MLSYPLNQYDKMITENWSQYLNALLRDCLFACEKIYNLSNAMLKCSSIWVD